MKGLEQECLGPPYLSVETRGGDMQDAVAVDCEPVSLSRSSRYPNPGRNQSVSVDPIWLRPGSWCHLETDFAEKDILGSEVNGLGKDK
jgi:hypothetical protein